MKTVLPCAIYTRKSSEEGLEQGFNSLDAQREACEAYILSQKEQGWKAMAASYDDGGFSGGNTERPALKQLLADIAARRVRIIVVYKVDRLTRSLADFAKLVELFDAHGVSFVSVTQQFNTTSSMGRLTLNVLLSFAQFEREVTGERIRDKIAASKKKGMWMGGIAPVGYMGKERTLVIDEPQAERIREIYRLYLQSGCVQELGRALALRGWVTPMRNTLRTGAMGGRPFSRGHLYRILSNPVYIGQIRHKEATFVGQHPAIVDREIWQAVQDRLKLNLQGHRTRSSSADPSLLTGLVVDAQGQRLTATHAKKGAKRYRYYVPHALHVEGRDAEPNALRLPARELEETVLRALIRFLSDASRLLSLMGDVEADEVRRRLKRAADLAGQLSATNATDRIDVLKRLVVRITVQADRLDIVVRIDSLWNSDAIPVADEPVTMIVVPVQLKRCGMAVRLIVPSSGNDLSQRPDPKVAALMAKAHDWFARLTSGRRNSIQAIAQEEDVSSSYVTRLIHLAFLDPEIVQRLLRGDHPPELNTTALTRMAPLPLDWAAQRTRLGMNA